jgi:hypothetical protein
LPRQRRKSARNRTGIGRSRPFLQPPGPLLTRPKLRSHHLPLIHTPLSNFTGDYVCNRSHLRGNAITPRRTHSLHLSVPGQRWFCVCLRLLPRSRAPVALPDPWPRDLSSIGHVRAQVRSNVVLSLEFLKLQGLLSKVLLSSVVRAEFLYAMCYPMFDARITISLIHEPHPLGSRLYRKASVPVAEISSFWSPQFCPSSVKVPQATS